VPTQKYMTARRGQKPRQEQRQRRLAAASTTHDSHGFARLQPERHAIDHGALAVSEAQLFDFEARERPCGVQRTVGDVGLGLEDLGQPEYEARPRCSMPTMKPSDMSGHVKRPSARVNAMKLPLSISWRIRSSRRVPKDNQHAHGQSDLPKSASSSRAGAAKPRLFCKYFWFHCLERFGLALLERERAHDAHAGRCWPGRARSSHRARLERRACA